jgi:TPR repeat protein
MQSAVARLSAKEVAALLARGDVMFGVGDIASARLFYERAAQGGDAQAALRLGESYDPAFLAWARLKGVSGDAVAAARWYLYARELGAAEAEVLLTRVAGTVESADHTHPATK